MLKKQKDKKAEGKGNRIPLINPLPLWRRVILTKGHKNESMYPERRNMNFYSDGTATMSGTSKISYYYTIDGYPAQLPIDFRDRIRFGAKSGVRVSFISHFEPTRIDWNSPQIRAKLRTWKTVEEDSDEVDEYNLHDNLLKLDSADRRKDSLVYLADAEKRRKRVLFKFRSMMLISGDRGESFDASVEEILNICASAGLVITRVTRGLPEYLKAFSPFSSEMGNTVMKSVGNTTIPDEMLARFCTYDQGKIGSKGVYWGTDIYSGYAVYKMLKKDSVDAENILIAAETGGGKSYFLKCLLIQLLSQNMYVGTINDIEGFEYLYLAGYVGNYDSVVVLNMAEGQGCYFDPVAINMTGDKQLDKDMFSFCMSFTLSVFKTLVGEKLMQDEWVPIIIDRAVAKVYADASVIESDLRTWGRSADLTLFTVYDKFKDLYQECLDLRKTDVSGVGLTEVYKFNDDYRRSLDLVIAKLINYFEPLERGGTRSSIFRERISLDEVATAKLVVCSFGMAGKDPSKVDTIQMALSQLSAASISHIRSVFSKSRGKYNFKVWEEFQRWGQFPDSDKTINTALTGGRKLGDINFIVTNKVSEMLENDRFGIFENITSFAIGAIGKASIREKLCDELSVPQLLPNLDSIATEAGNMETFSGQKGKESKYKRAFLVYLDKSVSSIVKMSLPPALSHSEIFRTGVDIDDETTKDEEDVQEAAVSAPIEYSDEADATIGYQF